MKLPIISLAILGGQILEAKQTGGSWQGALDVFASDYIGYDFLRGAWIPERLAVGYAPWLVKRFLLPIARPRVPFHGLPVSFS